MHGISMDTTAHISLHKGYVCIHIIIRNAISESWRLDHNILRTILFMMQLPKNVIGNFNVVDMSSQVIDMRGGWLAHFGKHGLFGYVYLGGPVGRSQCSWHYI